MKKAEFEQAISSFQTPFYLFDTDEAVRQIEKIRAVLGGKAEICYAMKANSFLVKELENAVDYFEVCSPGEFHICERAAVDMKKIILSGVYKRSEDIEYMQSHYGGQIVYTIESVLQWEIIHNYAKTHKLPIKVLLRLTAGNQFGMDEADIRRIIEKRSNNPFVSITGIQYFSGTQKKSPVKLAHELEMLDGFYEKLRQDYGFAAEKLEYGPGLPICYFKDDENVEDSMLEALAEQLKKLKFWGKITLEMGRFIAASCGNFFTEVVDIKKNNSQSYCIVDGGIHHLNYFGQMMAMKKPLVIHWREKSGETAEWNVCGSLCTSNDVLLKGYPFTDLKLGDILIFQKTGAYSAMEGISLFLSRELPQVVLFSQLNGFRLVRDHFPTDTLNY